MPETGPLRTRVVRLDPLRPDPDIIQKAGQILSGKKIVVFPAQCLYGLAAHALDEAAIEAVYNLKDRPLDNPILVLVKDNPMLKTLVADLPETAETLMKTFWPGSMTLVFNAGPRVPDLLTARTNKIGIRIPAHPVARALVNQVDFPITGTSANLSGRPGCCRIQDLDPAITEQAGLVLDAGPVKGGTGSTIVDVTENPVKIIRQGAVSTDHINAALA